MVVLDLIENCAASTRSKAAKQTAPRNNTHKSRKHQQKTIATLAYQPGFLLCNKQNRNFP
jgi:hypothetical protein